MLDYSNSPYSKNHPESVSKTGFELVTSILVRDALCPLSCRGRANFSATKSSKAQRMSQRLYQITQDNDRQALDTAEIGVIGDKERATDAKGRRRVKGIWGL